MVAAVDVEVAAGDPASLFIREETNAIRDFFRCAKRPVGMSATILARTSSGTAITANPR